MPTPKPSLRELTPAELDIVGGGASLQHEGTHSTTSGKAFLTFKFDTVFTTKIDWSGP